MGRAAATAEGHGPLPLAAVPDLADFSAHSIVWLVRGDERASIPELAATFARLREDHFADARLHVLGRHIRPTLCLLMFVARRAAAPYDLLVRLDLPSDSELTDEQVGALARVKGELPA